MMFLRMLLMLIVPTAPAIANGCAVDGVQWESSANVGGATLLLNGQGSRRHLFWDVYAVALYLTEPRETAEDVASLSGPKRLSIEFLHPVSSAKLREGWRDGFEDNHTLPQLAAMADRLEQSYPLLQDMNPGDRIMLDYLPGEGARLIINGQTQAVIPGTDYYQGILNIWLGKKPAQEQLRGCLLGNVVK